VDKVRLDTWGSFDTPALANAPLNLFSEEADLHLGLERFPVFGKSERKPATLSAC
jgi:hypothetical protein